MAPIRLPFLAAALTATTLAIAAAPASAQPACGDTITTNTTLTADLDCGHGNGLTIGADNVTLDLGGHAILNVNTAVAVSGYHDVVVRNGTVGGSTAGVVLQNATRSTVRDLLVAANVGGIVLNGADGNRVVNNRMAGVVLSVYNGSDMNVIRGNTLYWGREAVIYVNGSTFNRIVDNVVWTADDHPLYMFDADHNTVRRNKFVTDFNQQVWLVGSDDNLFTDNLMAAYGNYRGAGALIDGSNRNVWRRNETHGVPVGFIVSGADNVFASNLVKGAIVPTQPVEGADGFRIQNTASGTVLRNNTVRGFADDGIDAQGYRTLIKGNSANDNGDLGIFATGGSVDGGGNTASGNGNPLQCVGVLCR